MEAPNIDENTRMILSKHFMSYDFSAIQGIISFYRIFHLGQIN